MNYLPWFAILVLLGLIAVAAGRSRGTTLVYPILWGVVSLCLLVFAAWNRFPTTLTFVAWCSTFCPALTLLGMKRPQHHAWNAVVVTLLGLLIYPVLQSQWMRPGERFDLGFAWPWLLAVMIALSGVVYFGTRYAWSGLLVACAQAIYFLPYLPFLSQQGEGYAYRSQWALLVLAIAAVVAEWSFRRPNRKCHPADQIWLDFRDSFGLFWGLRWQERINTQAEQFGWPVRLEWEGFELLPADSSIPLEESTPLEEKLDIVFQAELRPTIRGLSRRFVPADWLDHRLRDFRESVTRNETGSPSGR